jgi:2,3-dihydroxybenzoate-AMP ligase
LPASHNFPLACPGILGTLLSGGRVVMLAPQPQSVFAAIEQEGVTITAVVPAVAQRWLAHAEEHGSAAPGSPTNWPGGYSPSSARRSSRSSAWPRGC